jgi:hypothetical protein
VQCSNSEREQRNGAEGLATRNRNRGGQTAEVFQQQEEQKQREQQQEEDGLTPEAAFDTGQTASPPLGPSI